MGYFDGEGEDHGSEEPVDSGERIHAGGIPADAERRLKSLAGEHGLFTSTLGVSEFALLSKLGPRPLAQVLGASVHQVGWQYLPVSARLGGRQVYCELDQVTSAWDRARTRAFDRLSEQASVVGADAVVGVRLRRGEHDWARGSVDYVVSGTAIRSGATGRRERPVLSDLSVQEYWKLVRAGWGPAALVATTSVYFVSMSTGGQFRRRMTVARNQELSEFTRGFTLAQETAVGHLRRQARAAHADGIVGVQLQHRVKRERVKTAGANVPVIPGVSPDTIAIGGSQMSAGRDERSGLAITIHAVGTAIRRQPGPAGPRPETLTTVGAQA